MFTKSTEYALRAVVFLAKNSSEKEHFGIKTIAHKLGFPEPYLAKVLQHLVKKKVLLSAKGPNGGFQAYENTFEISLLEIIKLNEGLEFFDRCGLGLQECNDKKPCPIHKEYGKFRDGLYSTLKDKKIKDIILEIENGTSFMDMINKK